MTYKCVCGTLHDSPGTFTAHFKQCDAWARANAPRSIWTPPRQREMFVYDQFGTPSWDGMHGNFGSFDREMQDYRDYEAGFEVK